MSKQQKNTLGLKVSERVTLIVSATIIILSFVFTGTPFFTFSWALLLIVAVDLIVLIGAAKQPEPIKRGIILLSILGGFFAAWVTLGAYFPWLSHQ